MSWLLQADAVGKGCRGAFRCYFGLFERVFAAHQMWFAAGKSLYLCLVTLTLAMAIKTSYKSLQTGNQKRPGFSLEDEFLEGLNV